MKLHPRLLWMVIRILLFVCSAVERTSKKQGSCTKVSFDNRRNKPEWFWRLGLVGVLGVCGTAAGSNLAVAQLTPDKTLGAQSSQVNPITPLTDRIDGGAIRGTNLFHSFLEFNVGVGRGVYFTNPTGIENILTRVTGGNPSNIWGQLGVLGNANLFLLNPNGIIFGPTASLSVNGSFVATTANGIRLANGDVFGANPSSALPNQILNVHPEALLFNQIAAQPTNSIAVNGADLEVPNGQSLLLIGGNVSPTATATGSIAIDGATLSAPGGRVEIGGVGGNGTVGLNSNGSILLLSFPDSVARTDVSLTNGAQVFVLGASGGSIALNAQNLNMAGGSELLAGIGSGMGMPQSQAGDVEVNATGAVNLKDGSSIFNLVLGVGNSGNIYINSSSLSGTNGAEVSTSTGGKGNAGNVRITARDTVVFDGVDSNGKSSGAFTRVASTGVGNGGDLHITTGSLSLTNGAVVTADTSGQGNAGNVKITTGSLSLTNGALVIADTSGQGNAGNVKITTGSLSLTNGALVIADTFGQGNAGNVRITARDTVVFDGVGSNGNPSGAFSNVESTGVGNGGDVKITTKSLSLTNGAVVGASTFGQGNAGNVRITARDTVVFDGVGSNGKSSGAFSDVESTGVGNGGDVKIITGSLSLTNGAIVVASTFGQGNAGNVRITARDTLAFDGEGSNGNPSGAFSTVESTGVGNGGDVKITTGSLYLTNGAEVIASTFGQGNAGNVRITARDTLAFDGEDSDGHPSGAGSTAQSTSGGNGGDVTITTGSLFLTNGAAVNSGTDGQGNAGNVRITARNTVAFDGTGRNGSPSGAASEAQPTTVGNGGDVTIITGSLFLTNGAEVDTSTFGQGNAGNVIITARDTVAFDASGAFSTVASTGVGKGGDITINTTNLNLTNGAAINAESQGTGNAGNININARQNIRADQVNISTESTQAGGGNITINANDIRLRHSSPILSSVQNSDSSGSGGNITINSKVFIALEDSDILANAVLGNGGNITINSAAFLADLFSSGKAVAVGRNPGDFARFRGDGRVEISADSQQGLSGTVNIPNFTFLQNSLSALPANLLDTNKLLANSCLESRRRPTRGRFIVTGNGGLAPRPGDQLHSDYPTLSVGALPRQGVKESEQRNSPPTPEWKLGDRVEEAQGLARTPDGRIIAGTKAELEAIALAKKSGCPYHLALGKIKALSQSVRG